MEIYKISNLNFTYPNEEKTALSAINLSINQGEFITICGKSGCGKTTLLKLLKPSISPYGTLEGDILFKGKYLKDLSLKEKASQIGFVMQNPDNQIVCDKVWHELAFGLENLGIPTPEIRARVAEMASFFGIENWFHKNITELSGGQKQLLCLASVMVIGPSVLILDEPTSQLDPIAAQEFLKTLKKINDELGTTVILTEHRLEDAFPLSNRVVVMDNGKIIASGSPKETFQILKSTNHDMYSALPTPIKVYGEVENADNFPLTIREGRCWLGEYSKNNPLYPELIPNQSKKDSIKETVIEVKDVWFRYEKEKPDVIKGLNAKIVRAELFAVVGGNSSGKTTLLSLISGLNKAYRGEILINGEIPSKIHNLYSDVLGVLPQNPQTLFVKKTVYLDLLEILSETKLTDREKEERIKKISALCKIENLLKSHPYDLSGGEQQRAALAKVLLKRPQILLLDEPTKGMDAHFKETFASILKSLRLSGTTIVMVSHDIEFCAQYADRCALVFDGNFTSVGEPREFFAGKNFYTTAANRMSRGVLPKAVLADDIILACGKKPREKNQNLQIPDFKHFFPENPQKKDSKKTLRKKLSLKRIFLGFIFALLFAIFCASLLFEFKIFPKTSVPALDDVITQIAAIVSLFFAAVCFFPQKEIGKKTYYSARNKQKLSKRTLAAAILILLTIPLTIFIGVFYLEDRRYYFISIMIILQTLLPFALVFESRKPEARELILISVLCAIAVAGRSAFFMLPQFKPVVALVIIAGVCFGGETGFLVGSITGFVSNFFLGQGPWTPWQMFAFGIIGFLAGLLFKKGLLPRTKTSLCIFGFLSALVIYGGIMNPASVIMMQAKPTANMIIASLAAGAPFDIIHALSTALFLWFISEPMIDKLERVKIKYGLIKSIT